MLTPDDALFPARFEPSKITGWTLEHHLDNQAARIILEQKGASGWINGDRTTFLSRYQVNHRPDGLITLPCGTVIAIETERRLKTRARYQSIIASHLLARTRKDWIYVFISCRTRRKSAALNGCLTASDTLSLTINTSRWKPATGMSSASTRSTSCNGSTWITIYSYGLTDYARCMHQS